MEGKLQVEPQSSCQACLLSKVSELCFTILFILKMSFLYNKSQVYLSLDTPYHFILKKLFLYNKSEHLSTLQFYMTNATYYVTSHKMRF